ncbi:MAG: gliding motility-associated ABC transporter permease subunit GldF [Sphingobacteriaceae bacterium]|nr:gliding motility-associated ABC transporter permease subunit GldF [Sphingobacteriaceae bacterium]
MFTVFKREISSFLSSLIAYIVIVVFLLVTGLFMWVFPDYSLLDFGYASLDQLFIIGPWVFMFLIPAITMRFFSEEKRTGTIELLFTKPVTDTQIILGKFFAGFALVVFAVLPTLLYAVTLWFLADPVGNIDTGGIIGSYIGLLLLGAVFVSIGLFASALTDNQIVAFILGLFLCFFFYSAFDSIKLFNLPVKVQLVLEQLGISAHFYAMSKGVLDSRDLVYFGSVIALFVALTKTVLESRKW